MAVKVTCAKRHETMRSELTADDPCPICEAEDRGYRRGITAAKARIERYDMPSGWKHHAVSAIGNG